MTSEVNITHFPVNDAWIYAAGLKAEAARQPWCHGQISRQYLTKVPDPNAYI